MTFLPWMPGPPPSIQLDVALTSARAGSRPRQTSLTPLQRPGQIRPQQQPGCLASDCPRDGQPTAPHIQQASSGHHRGGAATATASPDHQATDDMYQGPVHPLHAGGRDLHGPTRKGAWWPDLLLPWCHPVLQAGTSVKKQQSKLLKQVFTSLVDHLLHTGKRVVISGLLLSPLHGDVISSHICQLHLWLKGY
ncbi:hypothetical protein D4764_13G0012550 [Xyrichtys novacula]|uniref:Uncharacterized protein n=1 Tax=Xyrichtys novacula TaxID=13765 RepID=A0AAV1F3L4_XYRNO|nr:hypothetical protein D4764_13G0012550 [Xyrichtys novacula]